MKIKDLNKIIYSKTGDIQFCIIYDFETNKDIANGCSMEYAVCHYGDKEVKRVSAYEDNIVITV